MQGWFQGAAARLSIPGLLLLAAGAFLTYGSGLVAGRWLHRPQAETAVKLAGLALAVIGALLMMKLV